MKRLPAALAVVAVVTMLAGCTSEVTRENVVVTPGQTGTFSSGDTTVVVESAAPTSEEAYLAEVRGNLEALGSASDEQLMAAGDEACSQLDGGVDVEDVQLAIPGVEQVSAGDSTAVAQAADLFLCG